MAAPSHHTRLLRADADRALRTWMRLCFERLDPALQLIADGSTAPEPVHQARVALRQMRVAFSLVEDCPHTAPSQVRPDLVVLFRALGAHRDADMLHSLMSSMLGERWAIWSASAPAFAGAASELTRHALVTEARYRQALNALRAWCMLPQSTVAPGSKRWKRHVQHRLQRWHARLQADARGFNPTDVDAVHRLRKRLKRLRYALAFLQKQRATPTIKAYLRELIPLQEALGDFNDAHVAASHCAAWPHSADQATALAWLDFRQRYALSRAKAALTCLNKPLPDIDPAPSV